MSEDHRVPKRSDRELRQDASDAKRSYGTEKRWPVNIIKCLQSGWIPTRRGRKVLIYKIVPDEEMGDKDGRTDFDLDKVIITVKASVHEKANWGDGRARMSLAHELAHGVLHYGVPMFRESGASGTTELSRTDPAASAEHQAKVFASAFLIDDEVAATLSSPEEISTEFLVSLEAAKICFDRLAERARGIEHVRLVNEAFQASLGATEKNLLRYTGDFCPECGNATLIDMGIKVLCHICGHIGEAPTK